MRRSLTWNALRPAGLLATVAVLLSAAGCQFDGTAQQNLWKLPGRAFDGVPPQSEPDPDAVYSDRTLE